MTTPNVPKRRVVVLGAQSPSRVAVVAVFLAEAISRHGWSERVETSYCGFDSGAGCVDVAALAAAGVNDVAAIPLACPELQDEIERVGDSDILVVVTADELEELLGWPEADGKQLFAVSEFLGEDGWAVRDREAPLADYVEQVCEGVPLLLRAILAQPK
jgi:hypothetical protein